MENLMSAMMKVKCAFFSFLLLVFSGVVFSCGSTDSGEADGFEDGILIEVREMIGDELLDVIENELEVPIYRGDNPPDIESMLSQVSKSASVLSGITVVMSPNLLLKTNVPNDPGLNIGPGAQFADSYFRFSNQDMENYTINLDRTSLVIDSPYLGEGSFIIGDGNGFTIFGSQESVREDGTARNVVVISGIITEDGISSPHSASVMIDDGGVSDVIPSGSGRSFEDGNGVAELTSWPDQSQKQAAAEILPDIVDKCSEKSLNDQDAASLLRSVKC